uniref:Uncharacterized protein n=1 Tax=Lepeophtheirus salmonis TaxID=72036 RepID=A0A0K2UE62_LEPSM
MVDRSRLVRRWCMVVWLVFGLSRVGNVSNIARVSISNVVGHSLDATVGKGNRVLSLGGVSITGLISSKVESSIFITDTILVLVYSGFFLIGRSRMIWSRGWVVWSWSVGISRSRHGNSQKSR